MFVRRAAVVLAAATSAIALSTTSANAHFCFNAHAVQQGAEGMANSNGFASFEEIAFEFTGLCPAGIAVLADAAGVETWTAINMRTVMASGSGGKSKGISHVDFDAAEDAIPDGMEACS